ncbi:MAG: signal peptide peptidase SppA [Leptospiraceae bacterium]|nr:signal peptide peptidase SppA [Leptospiraceae bacterium]
MKHFYSLILLIGLLLQNCIISLFPDGGGIGTELKEHTLSGSGKDKILVLSIDGEISGEESSGFFGIRTESMVSMIKNSLLKALKDEDIKGIILKIDSPGGTVTASDILYREILEFKKKKKIPVIALYMGLAASGGYYVSMASDKIIAHPTTVTGSIGVIMTSFNYKQGLDKIGFVDDSITSGPNKSIGSGSHVRTEEQQMILQSIIDDLYSKFFAVVKKGRPSLSEDQLRPLCDGRVYTAEQAKNVGLIDEIGYFEDSINTLKNQDNFNPTDKGSEPRIIVYSPAKNDLKNIYQVQSRAEKSEVLETLQTFSILQKGPRFLYLWTGRN